jgi:hypothetical protein
MEIGKSMEGSRFIRKLSLRRREGMGKDLGINKTRVGRSGRVLRLCGGANYSAATKDEDPLPFFPRSRHEYSKLIN